MTPPDQLVDLTQASAIATAGWSGVAVLVLLLVAWFLSRRTKKEDDAEKEREEHRQAYLSTTMEWNRAVREGDIEQAAALKKRLDIMRTKGWNLGIILAAALVSSCATKTVEVVHVQVVDLGEHVRIMQPGDVLPALPPGEPHWCACTPTGLSRLLPEDAPILKKKEE